MPTQETPRTDGQAAASKTLDNGLRLLRLLAEHPGGLGMSELSKALGLHRTIVYRLIGTLMAHGLASRDRDNRYHVGLGVIELTRAVRPNLQAVAPAHLTGLADECRATTCVTVLEGEDAVSVLVVEPRNSGVHVAYRVGTRHPAALGAAGMAILAGNAPMPGERAEVVTARRKGYAVSSGELEQGAWGLAAPILSANRPVDASVGVVALSKLPEGRVAPLVVATAAAIARQLP